MIELSNTTSANSRHTTFLIEILGAHRSIKIAANMTNKFSDCCILGKHATPSEISMNIPENGSSAIIAHKHKIVEHLCLYTFDLHNAIINAAAMAKIDSIPRTVYNDQPYVNGLQYIKYFIKSLINLIILRSGLNSETSPADDIPIYVVALYPVIFNMIFQII